jgi:cell division septation protein DedD
MSMADDNTSRSYRSHDPQRQPAADPLAELARLIGQSDPFADFGTRSARPEPRAPQPPQQPRAPQATTDWRRTAAAMPAYDALPEEPTRRHHQDTVQPQHPHAEPHLAADTEFPRHDPYQTALEEPIGHPHDAGHYRREPQIAEAGQFRPRADNRTYAAPTDDSHSEPPYFEHGAPLAPHDEDMYDDPPRAGRRGGLLTAVTLIGCAMIGTAGAYGYRTFYVAPNANKVPPVITAETTPSKVVSASEIPTGKIIQDRVRDPAQNERLVSREEQPVEIRNSSTPPRVVLPAPVAPSAFPPPPSATGSTAAPATGNANEPKRIRTVTIRPDGADTSSRPVGAPPGGQPSAAAGARPAPAAKSPPPRNSGPLSLDPQANAPAQPAPAPRDRIAAVPPPTTEAAPATQTQPPAPRASAAPANGGEAGYLVQLSSQRSEAEAQTSFRALQSKYPDQLSGRSAIVRRVDLGAKGTYFRALVGPFGSSDEAGQFCSELKAAGGQCLIHRN